MFSVVIFEDDSVGIAHEKWFVPPNFVLWPKCTTHALYVYLRKGELPRKGVMACMYTLYRQCGKLQATIVLVATFEEALAVQQEALEAGHTSSTEGGNTKQPESSKRKR